MSLLDPDQPWMPCISAIGDELVRTLLVRNMLPINAALIRRSTFDRVGGFDESLARADDWDFWLRCAIAGVSLEFHDAPHTLALIRMHPSSLTRRDRRLLPSLIRIHEKAAHAAIPSELAATNQRQLEWLGEVHALAQLIDRHVPEDAPFVLIDDEKYRGDLAGYPAIPFLERDSRYAGPPADAAAAVAELGRLRDDQGCRWLVVADCAAWHLDQFSRMRELLIEVPTAGDDAIRLARVFRICDCPQQG